MLFSDLAKENNIFEIKHGAGDVGKKKYVISDGTNKSKTNDKKTKKKFKKDNKTVRGHLLDHMSNLQFNLFLTFKSAKIIWEKLGFKEGAYDARKKKYVISEWLRFQITDDKPIIEQVHIYENMYAEVLKENIKTCEILQANVLIHKFQPC